MRFYTNQHRYYCGIDLHARRMYICILNGDGESGVESPGVDGVRRGGDKKEGDERQ